VKPTVESRFSLRTPHRLFCARAWWLIGIPSVAEHLLAGENRVSTIDFAKALNLLRTIPGGDTTVLTALVVKDLQASKESWTPFWEAVLTRTADWYSEYLSSEKVRKPHWRGIDSQCPSRFARQCALFETCFI
jgi:hypothetical protein